MRNVSLEEVSSISIFLVLLLSADSMAFINKFNRILFNSFSSVMISYTSFSFLKMIYEYFHRIYKVE